MTEQSGKQSIAFELLGLTYGDLMALSGTLVDILTNEIALEEMQPADLAEALHAWAEAINEEETL